MKRLAWNPEKNKKLILERGLCFEDIAYFIENGQVLNIEENPNKEKYHGQCMYIIEIDGYAYLVPFVENEEEIFLKTIIPSRKATRKYLAGGAK
ncbi:MAG: toxin [Elusimicrobia bacterium RIFOXYB2_FULL_49_7]|nr:MAG: toxin [Elusimicrobia bacterium RIFOXYB2_FULL_49_7]